MAEILGVFSKQISNPFRLARSSCKHRLHCRNVTCVWACARTCMCVFRCHKYLSNRRHCFQRKFHPSFSFQPELMKSFRKTMKKQFECAYYLFPGGFGFFQLRRIFRLLPSGEKNKRRNKYPSWVGHCLCGFLWHALRNLPASTVGFRYSFC